VRLPGVRAGRMALAAGLWLVARKRDDRSEAVIATLSVLFLGFAGAIGAVFLVWRPEPDGDVSARLDDFRKDRVSDGAAEPDSSVGSFCSS